MPCMGIPSGGPPGMPGCWKGMLGGGGEKVLLSVIPRPSINAWLNTQGTATATHKLHSMTATEQLPCLVHRLAVVSAEHVHN